MMILWRALREDASGATMIEYALMVALIAVVLVATVTQLGQVVLTGLWNNITAQLTAAS
jgi:Flp pilus assembly pilin Flp